MSAFPDTNSLITVRDWIRFGVSQMNQAQLFFGHGSQNAWDETVYLVLHTLHLPLDKLDPFMDACLTDPEREAIEQVFGQRIHLRKPAAYITNEAWLGTFSFYVDERVIIPRSFIAELLQKDLAPRIAEPENVTACLDMCTGSGCLAILLAHAFPSADIEAVDIDTDALAVAQRNVADYDMEDQIELIQSDLFANVQRKYDIIVTNPPYVDEETMNALPSEYRAEPVLALASGSDGLDHIRRILHQAADYLYPNGVLIAEIGHNRAELEAEFPQLQFEWLETSGGDEYVFLLTKEQLLAAA